MSIPVHPTLARDCSWDWRKFSEFLCRERGSRRIGRDWSLTRQFAKCGEWGEYAASVWHPKAEGFSASGVLLLILCPWTQMNDLPQTPVIGLCSALVICVHSNFLSWRASVQQRRLSSVRRVVEADDSAQHDWVPVHQPWEWAEQL